eukprot:scaffold3426_cov355-Prasinococcus_capsulatus_cf.AAC.12
MQSLVLYFCRLGTQHRAPPTFYQQPVVCTLMLANEFPTLVGHVDSPSHRYWLNQPCFCKQKSHAI